MNPIVTTLLGIVSLVAIVCACAWLRQRKLALYKTFANIAEGTHIKGYTKLTDAAITTRFLLAKIGSDADHAAVAGASDIPTGVFYDEATAAEEQIAVRLLGAADETLKAVASAAIADGDFIVSAASGEVRTLPGTTGTYYIIGRALTNAAAQGDVIEFDPCVPVQRVVA